MVENVYVIANQNDIVSIQRESCETNVGLPFIISAGFRLVCWFNVVRLQIAHVIEVNVIARQTKKRSWHQRFAEILPTQMMATV